MPRASRWRRRRGGEADDAELLAAGGWGVPLYSLQSSITYPARQLVRARQRASKLFWKSLSSRWGSVDAVLPAVTCLAIFALQQFDLDAHQQVGFGLADRGEVVLELRRPWGTAWRYLVQSLAHFRFARVDPEVGRFGEHPLRGDQEAEHLVLERRARRLCGGVVHRGGYRHPVFEGRLCDRRLLHRRHRRGRRGLRHRHRAAGPARGGDHGGRRLRAAPAAGERAIPISAASAAGATTLLPMRLMQSGFRGLRRGYQPQPVLLPQMSTCSRSPCAASCRRTGCRPGRGRGPAAGPAPPAGCR